MRISASLAKRAPPEEGQQQQHHAALSLPLEEHDAPADDHRDDEQCADQLAHGAPAGLQQRAVVVPLVLENDGRERHDDRHQPEKLAERRDIATTQPADVQAQRTRGQVADVEGESQQTTVEDLTQLQINFLLAT